MENFNQHQQLELTSPLGSDYTNANDANDANDANTAADKSFKT